jgi:hypothetical protein
MASEDGTGVVAVVQAVLLNDPRLLRGIVERTRQPWLETELSAQVGAAP